MITELSKEGIILRVRLTPNSSSCLIKGLYIDEKGLQRLKVNVVSVPEKGKANKELVVLLSKKLAISKSKLQIVSGELERMKKFLIMANQEIVETKITRWLEEVDKHE